MSAFHPLRTLAPLLHSREGGNPVFLCAGSPIKPGMTKGMVGFPPIADIRGRSDKRRMRGQSAIEVLSKWAPAVVVASLLAALVGTWAVGPEWLFNALALIVGGLALLLLVARGMRGQFRPKEELGLTRTRDLIAYELVGKGMPRGSYLLGFAGLLTWLITGVQSAYSWLAFSGFALTVAWVKANVRYPADPTP